MRNLDRRLRTLEAGRGPSDWGALFDALPDDDLFKLERIVSTLADLGADTLEDADKALNESDAAFLRNIVATKEGVPCAA